MGNEEQIKNSIRTREIVILSAVIILSAVYYIIFEFYSIIFDDAFITYRYALNLAAGKGFVYNAGEQVYGTTTLLYAAYLSIGALITGGLNVHVFSQVSSLVFFNLIFVIIYFRYRINIFLIILVYLILFYNVYVYYSVFSGMETIFVVFLMFVMIIYSDKKIFYALVPLLVLTRLDASFIFLVSYLIILLLSLKSREITFRNFMNRVLLILLGVGFAFLVTYALFGSFIPNTILAKNIIYKNSVYDQSFNYRFGQLRNFGYPALISAPVLLFVLAIMTMKLIRRRVQERIVLFVFIFTVAYFLFEILFITLINFWYIPVLSFMIMINLLFILHDFKKHTVITYVILAAGIAYNLYSVTRLDYGAFDDRRYNVYKSELYAVSKMITPGAKVFCGDIGVIGFFCKDSYIYDYSGLVTPRAIEHNKIKMDYGEKGITTDYREVLKQIEIEKPDFANFRDYPFFQSLKNDSTFNSRYTLIYSGKEEILYRKK